MPNRRSDKLTLPYLALLVLCAGHASGAEVRGTVSVDYQGLFQRDNAAENLPVSVALQPAGGQRTPVRANGTSTIEIVGNRMQPSFLTVARGTTVEFLNRDDVYHELFSLSAGRPVKTRLGKAGDHGRDRASFTLDQPGTVHFFCRIHNKGYARIDVVETPYIQTLQAGGQFSFKDLQAGPWRLRVAAPAAETAWISVNAVTSPPPLHVGLKSRSGGGAAQSDSDGYLAVDRLYRTAVAKGDAQ